MNLNDHYTLERALSRGMTKTIHKFSEGAQRAHIKLYMDCVDDETRARANRKIDNEWENMEEVMKAQELTGHDIRNIEKTLWDLYIWTLAGGSVLLIILYTLTRVFFGGL